MLNFIALCGDTVTHPGTNMSGDWAVSTEFL